MFVPPWFFGHVSDISDFIPGSVGNQFFCWCFRFLRLLKKASIDVLVDFCSWGGQTVVMFGGLRREKTAQVGNTFFRVGSGYRTIKDSGFEISTFKLGHTLDGDQTTKAHGASQI